MRDQNKLYNKYYEQWLDIVDNRPAENTYIVRADIWIAFQYLEDEGVNMEQPSGLQELQRAIDKLDALREEKMLDCIDALLNMVQELKRDHMI